MKYYNIYGDDADYLYLGRESKPDIKLCPHCKMVLSREELNLLGFLLIQKYYACNYRYTK